jgi:hypothetical protein
MRRFAAVIAALALVALVAAPVAAAPGIKFTTQLTEDGVAVAGAGTAASPWIITTTGVAETMHVIGTVASATKSNPPLVGTYAASASYPFFLTSAVVAEGQPTLQAYFDAKQWPTDYHTQINAEIAGTAPFFIVGYPGPATSTSIWLQDGFHAGLGCDVSTSPYCFEPGMYGLQIDDDYPVGTYAYTGVLVAKNHTSITFTFVMTVVRG